MNSHAEMMWLGSLMMGAAVGLAAFAGREHFAQALDAVERDMAEKLRRLRASAKNLRKYLIAWLIAVVVTFSVFFLVLRSPIFAVLLSVFLLSAPWYLLRRMAEMTGGEFVKLNRLGDLIGRLDLSPLRYRWSERIDLWDTWTMLLVLTALLTVEWILRKWRYLP